jgi:hypothetical protein
MPAQSKAQQRFMGMVHATQKGDMENPSPEVEKAADSMSDTDAKDFASTSHKGLPDKIKEMILGELRSVKAIQTDYSKVLDAMERHLDLYKKSKGTPEQQTHLEHLKKLTTLKKKYSQELENKVKGIYTDADLEINEMGSGDIHFKKIMQYYNDGTPSVKKRVAIIVSGNKNASKSDIIKDLHQMGYDEIQETEEELGLSIKEMTTSDAAGPYNTPFAFGKPENEKKKGKRQADLTGYSVVNESALDIVNIFIMIAQLVFTGASVKAALDAKGIGPIDAIKQWWNDIKTDTAIKSIANKIKNDREIIAFLKLSPSQQRGKFRKLVASKLSAEEMAYLNKINKSTLQEYVSKNKSSKYKVVITENRWVELKREDSPATTKIGKGISNINKQLAEMEKFLNWYGRIKLENGISNGNFWKRTNTNIYKIKERLIKLEHQIRKISQ